jgi:6-phosphogluconolactonase
VAAAAYEGTLRSAFNLERGGVPTFDVVLLGLGRDGHTASIFPGTDLSRESQPLVAAPWVEKLGAHRITLTPLVLNHAAAVVFLVAGSEKAEVLRDVLTGPYQPDVLPAQIVRPVVGTLSWLVDRSAARLLA